MVISLVSFRSFNHKHKHRKMAIFCYYFSRFFCSLNWEFSYSNWEKNILFGIGNTTEYRSSKRAKKNPVEVCRKIAGENIKDAQDKYKYQYDKRSKLPEYRPAQRVWLYCTKVPVGKAPKLHRKWVGPYYITMIGPNHTFRLRNVRTNLEVKTLINAIRLKPYYDPEDRPTNPPVELADNEDELDPEELDQPRQQKQGKTNNADTQQGGNVNRNQNVDRRSQPERQNEPKCSNQQTKTGKTGNKSVRPRDGSQVKDKLVRPQEGNKKNSRKGGKAAVSHQIRQTGSGINDGESIACRRNAHGKMSHHDNQSNREATQVNKVRSKQESNLGRSNQSSSKQSGQNAEQKHKKQVSAEKTATSNSGIKVENKQANQKQTVTGSNAGQSEQKQKGKKVVIPSCIDCKAGNCKPIKETDIKAIVASQRSNGALYYKLKWQDNSTDWYFPCKIPSHMIREYHANRTMSGKKRKKPLHNKQHKFFTETDPQVNVAANRAKYALGVVDAGILLET